jgi:transcriptional regulator with PAS, ATPase and Fis domain
MPAIRLTNEGAETLTNYKWPGNIRQLRNLVEQVSVIETEREIDGIKLASYLPKEDETAPTLVDSKSNDSFSERELMYKFLFDMKKDLSELKKLVLELIGQNGDISLNTDQSAMVSRLYQEINTPNTTRLLTNSEKSQEPVHNYNDNETLDIVVHEEVQESLSLEDREKELIKKALEKHRGKRKYASEELGISERTLYRKIKEYNLTE